MAEKQFKVVLLGEGEEEHGSRARGLCCAMLLRLSLLAAAVMWRRPVLAA